MLMVTWGLVGAAQKQLEQEMQQQQDQGELLHGAQLAEYSRLEQEANAKTSKTKTALDTLATTQQASVPTDHSSITPQPAKDEIGA